jgi:hypothetical protein
MLEAFRFDEKITVAILLGIISSVLPSFAIDSEGVNLNYFSAIAPSQESRISDRGKIIGITALGLGAGSLVWHLNKAKTLSARYSDRHNESLIERVNPKLKKKLLTLVHGDGAIANRLLAGALRSYPDRSFDWLAGKVIYNLERDHGLY